MYIKSISDFRKAIRQPYAWPGGYPCYFICDDGAPLSFVSARKNRRLILESLRDMTNDGWRVIGVEINWEDNELYCAHSDEKIESAYAD